MITKSLAYEIAGEINKNLQKVNTHSTFRVKALITDYNEFDGLTKAYQQGIEYPMQFSDIVLGINQWFTVKIELLESKPAPQYGGNVVDIDMVLGIVARKTEIRFGGPTGMPTNIGTESQFKFPTS